MPTLPSHPELEIERLRRYLPPHLLEQWRRGEEQAVVQHLQSVLRVVSSFVPQQIVATRLDDLRVEDQRTAGGADGAFIQVTILFADISGFTAMSERLSQLGREGAEIITEIVNDYFAAMLTILARWGGDLYKFGGDALLAVFRDEEAALRACRAALEMQHGMERFAMLETELGTFPLRMKVGIGSGRVLLANLGDAERLEAALLGPALTRMAQAEHLAAAGQVLVDERTRQALPAAALEAVIGEDGAALGYYRLEAVADPARQRLRTAPLQERFKPDVEWLLPRLEALSPFLPPGVLARIAADPEMTLREGEHRPVTVLFVNFYGIDDLIHNTPPEQAGELSALLNQTFSAVQAVIHKYEGVIDKVDTYAVGFRIMAIFGAPVSHEDDPARAVAAALEIEQGVSGAKGQVSSVTDQDEGDTMHMARESFGLTPGTWNLTPGTWYSALRVRIGVNTGYVFAGNVGSSQRQEYSVMGDEVNLAARLMGAAQAGQVLVSQATAQHVSDLFELEEHPAMRVKGKSQPVRNYHVLRRAPAAQQRSMAARRAQAAHQGRFVGRAAEIELGKSLVDAACRGQGTLLEISGEAGVGKSRLVDELAEYAAGCGLRMIRGEAASYGRRIPYLPWIGVLSALLDLAEDEDQEADLRRSQLIAGLERYGLAEWAPVVGGVLGIHVDETPLTAALDAEMRQQRFFDVALQMLQGEAGRQPLLLVLDDMHWADDVSLALAAYVGRNAASAALLFVVLYRPGEQVYPWTEAFPYQTLQLTELDEGHSLELARSLLGETVELSPAIQRLVAERTQGNPLFVEEIVRALDQSQAIRAQQDAQGLTTWEMAGGGALAIPDTLASLLMSRIDRLPPTERRVLQVASVFGASFRPAPLGRVYPYGDVNGSLPARLQELAQADLVLLLPPEAYAFRHGLGREVAYESLPFALRRDLHVRVGEDIEQHHAGELGEYYGILAYHFDEGRAYAWAFKYLALAGDQARASFANEAALGHYARALEIAATGEVGGAQVYERCQEIREAMGDVYLVLSRYDEAVEKFEQVRKEPGCPVRRQASLMCKVARALEQQAKYEEAEKVLLDAREILGEDDEARKSVEMARVYQLIGWIHRRRGELEKALQSSQSGLAILEDLAGVQGALSVEAELYNTLSGVYITQGKYSEANLLFQRIAELRQQANDLPGLARAYNNLALTAWGQGDLSTAGNYLQQLLEISQRIGSNYFIAYGYNNLGVVSFTVGNLENALGYYSTALVLRERIGDVYGMAQTYINMGEALLSMEKYNDAHDRLLRAVGLCDQLHNEEDFPDLYCLLARVDLARADFSTALSDAENAFRVSVKIANLEWQGIARRIQAQAFGGLGQSQEAYKAFEYSLDLLHRSENQIEIGRTEYEYGLFLAQIGKGDQARLALERALDIFSVSGATQESELVRNALDGLGVV